MAAAADTAAADTTLTTHRHQHILPPLLILPLSPPRPTLQICSSTSRLLIAKSLAPAFLARLAECAKAVPLINPLLPEHAEATGALGMRIARARSCKARKCDARECDARTAHRRTHMRRTHGASLPQRLSLA